MKQQCCATEERCLSLKERPPSFNARTAQFLSSGRIDASTFHPAFRIVAIVATDFKSALYGLMRIGLLGPVSFLIALKSKRSPQRRLVDAPLRLACQFQASKGLLLHRSRLLPVGKVPCVLLLHEEWTPNLSGFRIQVPSCLGSSLQAQKHPYAPFGDPDPSAGC